MCSNLTTVTKFSLHIWEAIALPSDNITGVGGVSSLAITSTI